MSEHAGAHWPFEQTDFRVNPADTALVIIDMQYFDAHPEHGLGPALSAMSGGSYYFDRINSAVIPNAQHLATAFRVAGARVIYVVAGPETDDGSDLIPRIRARRAEMRERFGINGIFPPGSFERQVIAELEPEPGDVVVPKNTTGAFVGSNLDQILRITGIRTVVLTGVVTNVCVESTGRDASDRGYNVVVVDDACAAYDVESHESTMRNFSRFFGRVALAEDVVQELAGAVVSR
jgi:biuret amidohydrolase